MGNCCYAECRGAFTNDDINVVKLFFPSQLTLFANQLKCLPPGNTIGNDIVNHSKLQNI
jgi:hypothetical protein